MQLMTVTHFVGLLIAFHCVIRGNGLSQGIEIQYRNTRIRYDSYIDSWASCDECFISIFWYYWESGSFKRWGPEGGSWVIWNIVVLVSSVFPFPSWYKWHLLPHTPTVGGCLSPGPEAMIRLSCIESADTVSQNQSFLFMAWLSQAFCHSAWKLTYTDSLMTVYSLGSFT